MCCVMNHTRHRDEHVIALLLRDLVILSLGQRGYYLLVFIFFRLGKTKASFTGNLFF